MKLRNGGQGKSTPPHLLKERVHKSLLCGDARAGVDGQEIEEQFEQVLVALVGKHILQEDDRQRVGE